jgi:hypothetical protein
VCLLLGQCKSRRNLLSSPARRAHHLSLISEPSSHGLTLGPAGRRTTERVPRLGPRLRVRARPTRPNTQRPVYMLWVARVRGFGSSTTPAPLPPPASSFPRRARVPPGRCCLVKGWGALMRGPRSSCSSKNFSNWDLQAVVRSCSFAHAEESAGAARHAVPAREAQAEAPAPAPAAKQEASGLYGLEYLNLDHKPFRLQLSTMAAAGASRAAGDDVRELMISIIPAASTSRVQSMAVPPGRNKAGARTPRPTRMYVALFSTSCSH